MNEFKKTVDTSILPKYRKLHCWAFRRLPIMKFTYALIVISILLELYSSIFIRIPTVSFAIFYILLTIFAWWFLLYASPQFYFKLNIRKVPRKFGHSYECVFTQDGLTINNYHIGWNEHKAIEGKFGIAIISHTKVLVFFPSDTFTPDEYLQLKLWMNIS